MLASVSWIVFRRDPVRVRVSGRCDVAERTGVLQDPRRITRALARGLGEIGHV